MNQLHRRIAAAALSVVLLAGCASEPTRLALQATTSACQQGIPEACASLPAQQEIARQEAQANAAQAVAVAVMLPLIVLFLAAGGGHGGGWHSTGAWHSEPVMHRK
jgi:hypothetical protein